MGLKEKVLILQHSDSTPAGTLLDWCREKSMEHRVFRTDRETEWPVSRDFTWLIILGGGMNVDQEDRHLWLKREKEFIRSAIDEGKKVLGLCLGGQLIAEVLGASVHKHENWEVGWHAVRIDNETPLLRDSPNSLIAFQWHGYRFHLPEGAQRIATNSACEDQGFIFGDRVVSLQFHPEASREWIVECVTEEESGEPYPTGPYVQNATDVLDQIFFQDSLRNWFFQLLENIHKLNIPRP
jgi:GMP synthase-like glutamine amidotransferase